MKFILVASSEISSLLLLIGQTVQNGFKIALTIFLDFILSWPAWQNIVKHIKEVS